MKTLDCRLIQSTEFTFYVLDSSVSILSGVTRYIKSTKTQLQNLCEYDNQVLETIIIQSIDFLQNRAETFLVFLLYGVET